MLIFTRTLILLCLISLAALAEDISGKWTFNVETAAGSGTPTFTFKQAGEKFGQCCFAAPDAIEFTFEANLGDQKGKVVYKGKIEAAGKMAGSVDYAGLGSGTWTATKQ